MRHVHVDESNTDNWIGASERGLWVTKDRGTTWIDVAYDGESGAAQVYRIAPVSNRQKHVWLATDDGIWTAGLDGSPATQFALDGHHISSLSPGIDSDEIVVLSDHNKILRVSANDGSIIQTITLDDVLVRGLLEMVSFNRFVLELHFGKGFLVQSWSTIVNDYGGIAMMILGSTGFLFWWLPRRWRSSNPKGDLKRRQKVLRWLFQSHGPVIGLFAVIPILYLSITGIMVDHVQTLIDVGKEIPLRREALPPIYQYDSIVGEVSHVVAFPDEPDRYAVATRLGVLEANDSGKTWQADQTVPGTTPTLIRGCDFPSIGTWVSLISKTLSPK